MSSFLALEYEADLFHEQTSTISSTFSFQNALPEVLNHLQTGGNPNGTYKIIAFYQKDGSNGILDGMMINGRTLYGYSNVGKLYVDVTSYFTGSGAEVPCVVTRQGLNASSTGFLSFVVVRLLDMNSVRFVALILYRLSNACF
jgi:hypothetical protein